jgi:hypothetical protein
MNADKMNDRDILRHARLDRVNTFGIENHADLPAGCEAITRFANLTTISGKLNGFKVGQVRGPASLQALLDALWLDFKDIARTARAIDLDEPGFIEGGKEVTRLDAMMQNLYRQTPRQTPRLARRLPRRTQPQAQQDRGNSRRRHHPARASVVKTDPIEVNVCYLGLTPKHYLYSLIPNRIRSSNAHCIAVSQRIWAG